VEAEALEGVPLFAGLSKRDRALFAQHAEEVTLPQGTRLIEEGRRAYEFFVIIDGEAEVLQGDTVVGRVGPGDILGEIGVLETLKRTASVVAMSEMRLVVLDGRALRAMADTHADVYEELQRVIRERTSGA
jgi:CRP/FNR family transcriptional regulator, cyclic AMP receptor protein